ncbi:hypothetical protein V6N13_116599 [Hibiscus sabdariffa]
MEIEDFQILVNRVTATEAKMKTAERRKGGGRSDNKKHKRDDISQGSYKKANNHYGGSSAYNSAHMNQFTPKPQSVNKSSFPMMSVIARESRGRYHIVSTTRSLTGDNVDNNLTSAMAVVEVTTMFGIVHRMLTKHLPDLLYIRIPSKSESRAPSRMYHVRGREDEESPNVIAGTVELNSHPAYALIDSGSTHSFVCATILGKLNKKPEVVKTSLVVSNPLGKNMPINLICKDCPVTNRGIPFPIDLYVLPNCEFDLILELDWLSKHQAWIDCYNRRLYLRGLGNKSILLIDRKPTSIFVAMALQDEYDFGLPAMSAVSEFVDIFPEEPPGLPPT